MSKIKLIGVVSNFGDGGRNYRSGTTTVPCDPKQATLHRPSKHAKGRKAAKKRRKKK